MFMLYVRQTREGFWAYAVVVRRFHAAHARRERGIS